MKRVIDLLIIAIFISDFQDLVNISRVFKAITISPEFLSLAVFLCGLAYFGVVKKIVIAPKYMWLLMFLIVYLLCNVALNSVPAGAIIGGLRRYIKFMPLFFFPLVYEFSDEEILQKLKLILFLSLLQFPVVVFQRFFLYAGVATGDVVRGTLADSGVLTSFLNCVIAIVLSFYLQKRISLTLLVPLIGIIFFPMLINETKSTLIFLPFSIFIPVFFAKAEPGKFAKKIFISGMSVLMIGLFFLVYNQIWGAQSKQHRLENFLSKGVSGYLYTERNPEDIDMKAGIEPGRFDSIIWAIRELSSDPMKLVFGLGMGNVGPSLVRSFAGKYTKTYEDFEVTMTTITYLLWEIGFFGIMILLMFFFFISIDCLALKNSDNSMVSALATAWIAIIFNMMLSMIYYNVLVQNVTGFLFFLISGYLVSKKVDFEMENSPSFANENYYENRFV